MKIDYVALKNFRKLKDCRIEIAGNQTIFVGANNSGKTSAMDALIKFMGKDSNKKISTTDVTLCNWKKINEVGKEWVAQGESELEMDIWSALLPSLDVWLNVETNEIHHVSHLIPSLDWSGGKLGVRLQLQPTDEKVLEKLYADFREAEKAARETTASAVSRSTSTGPSKTFSLWPKSMREFLDRRLHEYFSIKCYLMDPEKPDKLPKNPVPLEGKPFEGLFRIHIINAQRGFSDDNAEETSKSRLSDQLRSYYDKHLNPAEMPDSKDVEALEAIHEAQTTFDGKLKSSFTPALQDLAEMNYPGFNNPDIILTSQIKPMDALTHKSGIQFGIQSDDPKLDAELLRLPETFNGLGYQNLISMLFQLVRFRDEWTREGKANTGDTAIEPLHLVLIEEPEAHLHVQAQQVFIRKAYSILQKGNAGKLTTQLVVSTHSSHIAHETDFTSLRYFKREAPSDSMPVPSASVVNLSSVFGSDKETLKFAQRYLKVTHSELFFADAAILVEGQAERILIPHLILHNYPDLHKSYTTVLDIGGSHAHRLRPLIEALGIYTLIISDLDSIEEKGSKKVRPQREMRYRTGNDTLRSWIPKIESLDEVLDVPFEKKLSNDGRIRVAYQCVIKVPFKGNDEEAFPYTFEDALTLTNLKLFQENSEGATGMLKSMINASEKDTFEDACSEMYDALKGVKAQMALDILFRIDPGKLMVPVYIAEGLRWLEQKFESFGSEVPSEETHPQAEGSL